MQPEEVQDAAMWERFQEAGLLDQASLEKKDREALVKESPRLKPSCMITNTVIGNLKRRDERSPRRRLKEKFQQCHTNLGEDSVRRTSNKEDLSTQTRPDFSSTGFGGS